MYLIDTPILCMRHWIIDLLALNWEKYWVGGASGAVIATEEGAVKIFQNRAKPNELLELTTMTKKFRGPTITTTRSGTIMHSNAPSYGISIPSAVLF